MKELPLVENHSLTFKWMRLFTLIIEEAEKVVSVLLLLRALNCLFMFVEVKWFLRLLCAFA